MQDLSLQNCHIDAGNPLSSVWILIITFSFKIHYVHPVSSYIVYYRPSQ